MVGWLLIRCLWGKIKITITKERNITMSHFTVLVIGGDVEKQLAPFQENNMGDCPEEFLEFQDCTDEVVREWDKLAEEDPCEYEKYKNKTIEQFADEYFGYSRDKNGERFGYYENPNRKWDWYQIGGRWTGYFKLKEGKIGVTGTPGLMTNKNTDPTRADQALKSDIDFEFMRNEAEKDAAKRWDDANALMGETRKTYEDWPTIRSRYSDDNIGLARDVYWEQEAVKALQSDPEHRFSWNHDDVMCPREECIKNARESAISTFAMLKDGKWYEEGSMGWWGIALDEKDKDKWNSEFSELLNSLPDDTLLTVVDCHI